MHMVLSARLLNVAELRYYGCIIIIIKPKLSFNVRLKRYVATKFLKLSVKFASLIFQGMLFQRCCFHKLGKWHPNFLIANNFTVEDLR